MRTLVLLCLLGLATIACGQVNISGKVLSSTSSLPVANASVYINNSSIGTTTDEKGEFSLKANYSGRIDLVVSHLSFERKVTPLPNGEPASKLLITVDPKNGQLNEVVINADGLKPWYKWRTLFTKYFIGTSPFAKKCTITNPEVLVFHYNKARGSLRVTSRSTLILQNKALGYTYKIDLNTFDYSFKTLLVNSDVTAFFESITPSDSTEQKTFSHNRMAAYTGSKMEFIRSVYKRNYAQKGFTIVAIHMKQNAEKLRIQHMISDALAQAYLENKNTNTVTLASIAQGNADTVYYYNQKLAEPDFVIKDTTSVKLKDSLTLDLQPQNERLHLRDTLLIQYNENYRTKPIAIQLPVKNASFTVNDKQVYTHNQQAYPVQYSIMVLTPKKDIIIYANGGYNDGEIFTDGYMATGKASCLLPWDYKSGD